MARKKSSALTWIVAEAKRLKRNFPHRFKKWTEYVAQASAIYASKHGGRSPVGKKRRKVAAVKYLERGEKHNARSRIVRVNRTKSGRFKSFKRVSGIGKGQPGRNVTVPPVPQPQYLPGYKGSHKARVFMSGVRTEGVNSRILQAIQDKVYWIEVLEKNIRAAEVARSAASKRRDRKTRAVMVDNIKRWKDLLRGAKKELTVMKRNLR